MIRGHSYLPNFTEQRPTAQQCLQHQWLNVRNLTKNESSQETLGVGMSNLQIKEALAKVKSSSSRSIPSSPTSCYSLPTSFEKFTKGIKKQGKVKGLEKVVTTKLGLIGSVRGASQTTKKVFAGNSIKSWVRGFDLGPNALRKSWEGNMDVKSRDGLISRATKNATNLEGRSNSAYPPMEDEDPPIQYICMHTDFHGKYNSGGGVAYFNNHRFKDDQLSLDVKSIAEGFGDT